MDYFLLMSPDEGQQTITSDSGKCSAFERVAKKKRDRDANGHCSLLYLCSRSSMQRTRTEKG